MVRPSGGEPLFPVLSHVSTSRRVSCPNSGVLCGVTRSTIIGSWKNRANGGVDAARPISVTDATLTHVRHTLSCFLGHHTYRKLIERDEHTEYVCVQCGHPLLFRADTDPYGDSATFNKKVRYLCGLFGHEVHLVSERDGYREFACHCGHTFLKSERDVTHITHPAICVVSGHRIRYVTSRGGYMEYVCRDCGHPFCFAEPAPI